MGYGLFSFDITVKQFFIRTPLVLLAALIVRREGDSNTVCLTYLSCGDSSYLDRMSFDLYKNTLIGKGLSPYAFTRKQ